MSATPAPAPPQKRAGAVVVAGAAADAEDAPDLARKSKKGSASSGQQQHVLQVGLDDFVQIVPVRRGVTVAGSAGPVVLSSADKAAALVLSEQGTAVTGHKARALARGSGTPEQGRPRARLAVRVRPPSRHPSPLGTSRSLSTACKRACVRARMSLRARARLQAAASRGAPPPPPPPPSRPSSAPTATRPCAAAAAGLPQRARHAGCARGHLVLRGGGQPPGRQRPRAPGLVHAQGGREHARRLRRGGRGLPGRGRQQGARARKAGGGET